MNKHVFWIVFAVFALQFNRANSQESKQPVEISASAVEERIVLDGRLDERAWRTANPTGGLIQVVPRQGEAPSEGTEVRVLYDSDALYFGITCRDQSPSAIVAKQLTRDADLEIDDYVMLVLDPFFDQRNGYFFMVNAAGARSDGQISNNDEHLNYQWDGIWNAAARITETGWEAEVSVPFKSLRFKPGQTTWGLNIERQIKRRNEISRWSGARRNLWITNLAEAGRVTNMPSVHLGNGLDIRPYGLVKDVDGDWKADGGVDVSKNLTANLNASLTVRTDFAETEVDNRQVNLTRFPTYYPEKRAFFLEGAGVFDTVAAPPTSSRPDLLAFFSRRIGLYRGTEVPVIAGGKLSGRLSNTNVGFLDVATDRMDDLGLSRQNLMAGRVSRNFWRQSYVGGIFTYGNPSGTGGNNLIGVDARLATSQFRGGKNLGLDVFLFRTDDQTTGTVDYATGFRLDYPNDLWDLSLSWKQIGNDFRPALGFVRRTGTRRATAGITFGPRPERAGIRQVTVEIRPELFTDLEGVVQNWDIEFTAANIDFESGDSIAFSFIPEFERLDEPFEISSGVVLPPGSYEWNRFEASFRTASKRPLVAEFDFGVGEYYSGNRRFGAFSLTFKPNKNLLFVASIERHDVSLKQGDFFTQLLTAQVNYNFSPNVSWSNLVQYDNESRILGLQSRLRWIIKPGNDLFLVLNRGWYRTFEKAYVSSFDRGTIKLAYTFRF